MNSQLPECPRGSGLLLGRWVRVVRRSLAVANGDSITLSPRGPVSMTAFGAVPGLSSQALFLEVITEDTDQHCSTLRLPQRGQTTPPSS